MLFHFRTVHFPGFTAQFQNVSGLSLITTPRCHYQEVLCHSSACRISAFTKPISTLAFRFITRPSHRSSGPFFASPLQCKLFLALPSLRKSDPFRHTTQLYLAQTYLLISKTKLVKSQPEQFKTKPLQVATLRHRNSTVQYHSISCPHNSFALRHITGHCPCRSLLCDTLACLSISTTLPAASLLDRYCNLQGSQAFLS